MSTAVEKETTEFVNAKLEAQRSATLVQLGALGGAVICIACAALLQEPINTQRKELELVLQSDIYKELPPEYAWVSAAGGTFRGVAADILWMRAEKMKQEGKYYELHQLGKWICTLQPRFPAVWTFQAWNMAYNVSVATHTAQERWQWVYNGIRLLRDEGVPNNDRVVPLYHYLAWIWFHKVGDRLDDFHMSYKRAWAATMETLLGPPPAAVSNKEAIDWFRPVAEAPRRLEDLLAAKPGVAPLVEGLAALGIDVDEATSNSRVFHPLEEKFFRKYAAWRQAQQTAALRKSAAATEAESDAKLYEFLAAAPEPELEALLAYMRSKVLREQYKMDPQYMLDMTGRLGSPEPLPIDWRTPWSQGLYWAMYGTEKGRTTRSVKEFDLLAADRVLLFALKTIAKTGRYVFRLDVNEPMNSFLAMLPDLRYIEAMHQKYIEIGPKHIEEGDPEVGPAGEMLRSGHVNELREAILNLYLAGHLEEARKYLDYLVVNYKSLTDNEPEEVYLKGLDFFVQAELKEYIDSMASANSLIFSLLSSGYTALAGGFVDEYSAAVRNAAMVYERYQKDRSSDPEGRRSLPPFAQMRANALVGTLLDPGYPLITRAMIWAREQDDIRRRAYDFAINALREECDREGFDVAKAFAEPPGMEQFRNDNPTLEQAFQKKKPPPAEP